MAGPGLIGGFNLVGGLISQGERTQAMMDEMFDQHARRKAGGALAAGDTRGAAAILGDRGMLKEVDALNGQATTQDALKAANAGDFDAARKAAAEGGDAGLYANMTKDQAAEAADRAEWMINAGEGLKLVPVAERQAAFAETIAPTLRAMKIPDDHIAQMAQGDMSDANIDLLLTTLGKERQKFQFFQTKNAIYRGDPAGGTVEEALPLPEDPTEPLKADLLRAQAEAARANVPLRQAQAEKARRPPAARASGGGGGGGKRSVSEMSVAELKAIAGVP